MALRGKKKKRKEREAKRHMGLKGGLGKEGRGCKVFFLVFLLVVFCVVRKEGRGLCVFFFFFGPGILDEDAATRVLGSTAGGLARVRHDDGLDSLVKDLLETLLGEGRALHVVVGVDLLGERTSLLGSDGGLVLLLETIDGVLVLTKIELGADEHELGVGAVVRHLSPPLAGDVLEGRGVDDGEADEEDVGLGVRKGTESVVILLTGGIPKTKTDGLVVDHHVGTVVVKDGGHVLLGERVASVSNEQARLSDGSITNNDELD